MTAPPTPPPVLLARGLTKRYRHRHRPALDRLDLEIPAGRVIGLVGPNGAGKTTLLQLACGLLEPTAGELTVLGRTPAADAGHLARVGFVAQDTPAYPTLTVAGHLELGARLNPGWDGGLAERRLARVGIDPSQRAGALSGGQRAQLALTLAAAKRPDLLILDEPAAALDPLARRVLLGDLLAFVAELGSSAILSSHLLGDVGQVCDHLVVICGGRLQTAGDLDDLLATHGRIDPDPAAAGHLGGDGVEVILGADGDRPGVVRLDPGRPDRRDRFPAVGLEELVLAYLTRGASDAGPRPGQPVGAGEGRS